MDCTWFEEEEQVCNSIFLKLFGFEKNFLIYFSFCRKKYYSDVDDLISPGLKLGVDVISLKTWFYTLNYCGCYLSSSVSFYIVYSFLCTLYVSLLLFFNIKLVSYIENI